MHVLNCTGYSFNKRSTKAAESNNYSNIHSAISITPLIIRHMPVQELAFASSCLYFKPSQTTTFFTKLIKYSSLHYL